MDTAQGLCIYYPGNICCLLGSPRLYPSLAGLAGVWLGGGAHCLTARHTSGHSHVHMRACACTHTGMLFHAQEHTYLYTCTNIPIETLKDLNTQAQLQVRLYRALFGCVGTHISTLHFIQCPILISLAAALYI